MLPGILASIWFWAVVAAVAAFVAVAIAVSRILRRMAMPPAPRDALLSEDELENHARDLAAQIKLSRLKPAPSAEYAMHRIRTSHDALVKCAARREELVPASRWIIDHTPKLMENAVSLQDALKRLPPIPACTQGVYAGYPRIYAVAAEIAAHSDAGVTGTRIERFVKAYQATAPLRMSELWALPLMLRLALLTQAAVIAEDCVRAQTQRRAADEFADGLLPGVPIPPETPKGFGAAFVERLASCLRDEHMPPDAMRWLQERLTERDVQLQAIIASEHGRQARNQHTIGNAITSLSRLDHTDWNDAFERLSTVDGHLLNDPAEVYQRMDFASRSLYRQRVAEIARAVRRPESMVARQAVASCKEFEKNDRRAHVGWHIMENGGEDALLKALGGATVGYQMRRVFKKRAQLLYVAGAFAISTALGAFGAYLLHERLGWLLAGTLLTLPAQAAAQTILIHIVRRVCPPRILPRLEIEDVPSEYSALVVVPALIPNAERAAKQAAALETLYLANRLPSLRFALLSDFPDAETQTLAGDSDMVAAAQRVIDKLNLKYGPRFFLLHRPRQWNAAQKRYMGWERKRGALVELNRLLLGGKSGFLSGQNFGPLVGNTHVITLDADTVLPPGAAAQMLGVALHPLNISGEVEGRRVGSAVFAPRVSMPLSHIKTPLQALFGGEAGVDYYTSATADVYQDLDGVGGFSGKGIYDVRAFQHGAANLLPENAILSHDLIEGLLAGSSLASDIVVFDGHPAHIHGWAMRLHRWTRGDWQLLPYLLPFVKDAAGLLRRNPLSMLSTYRVYDNLRRSLTPFATLACVVLGAALRLPALAGLALMYSYIEWPLALPNFFRPSAWRGLGRMAAQTALRLALLPTEAILCLNAALVTAGRVLFTRRNMLQWVTAADAERADPRRHYLHRCWAGPLFGIILPALAAMSLLTATMSAGTIAAIATACLFGAAWLSLPFTAFRISQPVQTKNELTADDNEFLYGVALRTWRFFEQSVTFRENHLPPDNVQSEPRRGPARRTSPTNIGLYLASCVSAHRMGFISASQMLSRIENCAHSLRKLPMWRGHPVNWVSTANMEALHPRYISSVDSGNLAACLWLVASTLRTWSREISANKSPAPAKLLDGAKARLRLAEESGEAVGEALRALEGADALKAMTEAVRYLTELRGQYAREACEMLEAAIDELKLPSPATRYAQAAALCSQIAENMDFSALYDPARRMFAIGYDMEAGELSTAHYDLLASESRLLSFVAIAKGDVPSRHFARLGRPVGKAGKGAALLSWGGTMFEYLMPPLILTEREGSLLGETNKNAVWAQRMAAKPEMPWGVSESGYNAFDLQLNYQYRAFGVMSLALRGGVDEDDVIAPYASALALAAQPKAAAENLRRMAETGWLTPEGFYEAADYTRAAEGETPYRLVKSCMAHHQGMVMLSISNALYDGFNRAMFLEDPRVRAHDILLQERSGLPAKLPARKPIKWPTARLSAQQRLARNAPVRPGPVPETHLLAGCGTTLAATSRGLCFASSNRIMWNRWRGDPSDSRYGIQLYLRDATSGKVWAAQERGGEEADESLCSFLPDCAVYQRSVAGIQSTLTAFVSPEDGAVCAQLTLHNLSDTQRRIEVTSFMEICLSTQEADTAHPAFQNLFVEAQTIDDALVFTRRPREADARAECLLTALLPCDLEEGSASFTASRQDFLGRGNDATNPSGLHSPLSGTSGAVLDPCSTLRRTLALPSGGRATVTLLICPLENPSEAHTVITAWKQGAAERALDLAGTYAQVETAYLGLARPQFKAYHKAAAFALFNGLPAQNRQLYAQNARQPQNALWRHGISGDLPIVAVTVSEEKQMPLVKQAINMHELWRLKGVQADLVIINESGSDYLRPVYSRIEEELEHSSARELRSRPGGAFVLDGPTLAEADRDTILGTSALLLEGAQGDITAHLARFAAPAAIKHAAPESQQKSEYPPSALPLARLVNDNGYGGFTPEGDYMVRLPEGRAAPAPWCNVLANEHFGTLISERGTGYTWHGNSREGQLTAFRNDPVSDPYSETLYLRDEETGCVWSPMSGPATPSGETRAIHRPGVSSFHCAAEGLQTTVTVHVDVRLPVKAVIISISNPSPAERRLSAFYLADFVMGNHTHAPFVFSGFDEASGVSWARSTRGGMEGVAFVYPGGAAQSSFAVPAAGQAQVSFLLGWASDVESAVATAKAFNAPRSLRQAQKLWHTRLTAFSVSTKDAQTYLASKWLPYQAWACRFLARTGFYQAGGAYGFRDQLQDCLLLVYYDPAAVREHLLRCAAHQFEEGDVQHWWHEPRRGVRTRITDDLLWLPYVLCDYVEVTGDSSILHEKVPYLRAPALPDGHEDAYGTPEISSRVDSVLNHAILAVNRACQFGEHGLPLMGSGDWNDAMNRVGLLGRGESVWLGWFLVSVLRRLAPILYNEGRNREAAAMEAIAREVTSNIEEHGWDGAWYRRAFDDHGRAIGSSSGEQCRIDLIAQCWAVLSQAGDKTRARVAMEEALSRLWDGEAGVLRLLWPPFDGGTYDPGYIQGYVPGVRENGGQYTHAAVWAVMALAMLGETERAWTLFSRLMPSARASTAEGAKKYRVEPYVLAADVYTVPPHAGRGGWTWYTGSAAWMARVYREHLLGLTITAGRARLLPRWTPTGNAAVTLRIGKARYTLKAFVGDSKPRLTLDGLPSPLDHVPLVDDGLPHEAIFDCRPPTGELLTFPRRSARR